MFFVSRGRIHAERRRRPGVEPGSGAARTRLPPDASAQGLFSDEGQLRPHGRNPSDRKTHRDRIPHPVLSPMSIQINTVTQTLTATILRIHPKKGAKASPVPTTQRSTTGGTGRRWAVAEADSDARW
jgi:hypothetical protein